LSLSLSRLSINIPERYTIGKVWPSDATSELGYYNRTNTTYCSVGMRSDTECTQSLAGGFPWSGIRSRELLGLTTVTDPSYYDEVEEGTYFHNILTVELLEEYAAPDGWARSGILNCNFHIFSYNFRKSSLLL
jgi:hypothetical protein